MASRVSNPYADEPLQDLLLPRRRSNSVYHDA